MRRPGDVGESRNEFGQSHFIAFGRFHERDKAKYLRPVDICTHDELGKYSHAKLFSAVIVYLSCYAITRFVTATSRFMRA